MDMMIFKGKLSEAQLVWCRLFEACPGIEYYIWMPSDWEEARLVLEKK